jgi:hypothetical protein
VIIELGFSPDQSRHINRLADGTRAGKEPNASQPIVCSTMLASERDGDRDARPRHDAPDL